MAKKTQKLDPLTFTEIVLRGDSDTIRKALEARTQIDTLLVEREEAYQRISELESQVESIVGEEGIFPFPSPPAPVFAFDVSTPKKAAKKAAKPVNAEPEIKAEAPAESAEPIRANADKKAAPAKI